MFSKVTGDILSFELNLSSPRVTCDDWSQWGPVINMFVFCFQLRWNAESLGEILTTAVSRYVRQWTPLTDQSSRVLQKAQSASQRKKYKSTSKEGQPQAVPQRSHSLRRRGHSRLQSIGNYLHKYQERPSAPLDTSLTGYKDSGVQVGRVQSVPLEEGYQVKSGQTRRSRLKGFAFYSETVCSRNVSNRMRFFSRVLLVAPEGQCGAGRGRRGREQVTTPIGWN